MPDNNVDVLLDDIVDKLRTREVPEFPRPAVAFPTRAPLQDTVTSRRKLAGITAIAAIAISIVVVVVLPIPAVTFAFADVLENVRLAKSLSYVHRGRVGDRPLATFTMYAVGDDRCIEYETSVNVIDLEHKKGLIVDRQRKHAFEYQLDPDAATSLADRVEKLFELIDSSSAERVGTERRDGREMLVYRVDVEQLPEGLWAYPGATNTIVVDSESKLPESVRISWPNGDFVLYEKFKWNEPVDPDLFRFRVPAGYTVETSADRINSNSSSKGEDR